MNNIKDKATEVYQNIKRNNFELAGKVNINNIDRININLIIDLAREFCVLQKQECYNNVQLRFEVDEDSILECKNVCDEY